MPERPYTLLSCGMSIDGYIDTATDERLVLSNDADLDRVDAVRHVLPVPVAGLDGGLPVLADGRVWAGLGVAGPTPAQAHDLAVTAVMTTT